MYSTSLRLDVQIMVQSLIKADSRLAQSVQWLNWSIKFTRYTVWQKEVMMIRIPISDPPPSLSWFSPCEYTDMVSLPPPPLLDSPFVSVLVVSLPPPPPSLTLRSFVSILIWCPYPSPLDSTFVSILIWCPCPSPLTLSLWVFWYVVMNLTFPEALASGVAPARSRERSLPSQRVQHQCKSQVT